MKARFTTIVLAALLATAGLANAGGHLPGEGVTLTPAVATWEDARPVHAIFELILEELGYDLRPAVGLSNPIFYQAVALGDVDFWTSGWFPLHEPQLPAGFSDSASIVGTIAAAGGVQV